MSYERHAHSKHRWDYKKMMKSWRVGEIHHRRAEYEWDIHDGLREYWDVCSDYAGEPLDYARRAWRHLQDTLNDRRSRRYLAADRGRMFTRPNSEFVREMKEWRAMTAAATLCEDCHNFGHKSCGK